MVQGKNGIKKLFLMPKGSNISFNAFFVNNDYI